MTTTQVESLRDKVAAGDYDIWQAEKAVREVVESGKAAMAEKDYDTARTFFDAAAAIAQWIQDELRGWEREFQARRLA
jgi:hypothetical protein